MYKNVFLPSIYLNTRVVFRQMMPHVCNTMEKSTKINNWHLKKKNHRQNIHVLYTSCKYVQLNCKGKQLILEAIRANQVLNMQHFDEKQTS